MISDLNPTKLATQPLEVASVLPAQSKHATAADANRGVPNLPTRYQILAVVGCGGMGIVYKAHDIETDEIVALKILKPEIASDEAMREKLRQEVCLARRVTHKNVCRIHEFNRGTACISMELIEGESLSAKLQREGALPVPEAIHIARQVCAGLREAHAQGIIHRDLKPGNIMIDRSGNVKIMDFGIARLAEETGAMTQTVVGTPEYMSPEQIELKPLTPRSDIYSLGLVLYEMLTGSQPFSGGNALTVALQHISKVPKRPSEVVLSVGPRLDALVMKCLHRNPAKRFRSVDELETALALHAKSQSLGIKSLCYELIRNTRVLTTQAAVWARRLHGSLSETQTARRFMQQYGRILASFITPARIRSAGVAGILAVAFMSTAGTFAFVIRKSNDSRALVSPSHIAKRAPRIFRPDEQPVPVVVITPEALFPDQDDAIPNDELPATKQVVTSTRSSRKNLPPRKIQIVAVPAATSSSAVSDAALPLTSAGTYPELSLVSPTPKVSSDSSAAATPGPSVKPQPDLAAPVSYLEVGSFKDTKWADSAVEQLDQLGFHAICVHKSHLWMQSYRVEVGPYQNASDLEAAVQRLSAMGFKPHAIKD